MKKFIDVAEGTNIFKIQDLKDNSQAFSLLLNVFKNQAAKFDNQELQRAMHLYREGFGIDTSGSSLDKKQIESMLFGFLDDLSGEYSKISFDPQLGDEIQKVIGNIKKGISKGKENFSENLIRNMAKGNILGLFVNSGVGIDLLQNKESFKRMFGVDMDKASRDRTQEGLRMLGGLENYGQMKFHSKWYGKVFKGLMNNPTLYILSSFVLNFQQTIHNAFVQGVSLTADVVTRRNESFDSGVIKEIRELGGILKDAGVPVTSFGIKDMFSANSIARISENLLQAGLHNVGDIINESRLMNRATHKAIVDFGYTPDEFLSLVKGSGGREKTRAVSAIQDRAEKYLTQFGFLEMDRKNAMPLFSEGRISSKAKQAARSQFMFMSSFGFNSFKQGIYALKDLFTGNWGQKRAIELYKKNGKDFAGTALFEYYTYNEGMMHFMHKLTLAMHLGYSLDRSSQTGTYGESSIGESFELSKLFNSGLVGIESNAITRTITQMLKGFELDWSDGGINHVVPTGALALTVENFLKEMTRKSVVAKVLASSARPIMESLKDGSISPELATTELRRNFLEGGAGYASFVSEGISKFNYTFDDPKINSSHLEDVIPFFNDFKNKYRELNTQNRIKLLTELPESQLLKRAMYYVPISREFSFGGFDDEASLDNLLVAAKDDINFQKIYQGDLPLDEVEGYRDYVYNIMIDFAYPDAEKGSEKKREGLAKKLGGYGPLEGKENMFVKDMIEALGKDNSDYLIELFNTADESKAKDYKVNSFKQGRQLIGFLEAESPGSSREVMGYIINKEYLKERETFLNNLGFGSLTRGEQGEMMRNAYPEQDNQIKGDLVDKYVEYLPIVDKESYVNASLLYLYDRYELGKKLIKVNEDENGKLELRKGAKMSTKIGKTFEMDMFTKMQIEEGDLDGYAFANAMTAIFMPGRNDSSEDKEFSSEKAAEYFKHTWYTAREAINYIRGETMSEQRKSTAIQGIIRGMSAITKEVLNNPQIVELAGEELQELKSYVYGSNKAINDLGEELLEHEGFKNILGTDNKPKTSTVFDDYAYSGGYYNSKYSKGGYSEYKRYNKLYSSNKTLYSNFRSLSFDVSKSQLFKDIQYELNSKKTVYTPREREMLKRISRKTPRVTYKSKFSSNGGSKKRGGNVFTLKQPKAPKIKVGDLAGAGDTSVRIGRIGPSLKGGSVKLPKGIFGKFSTI